MGNLKVLVIDVNTTTAYRIRKLVDDHEMEMITATNSFEAISKLTNYSDIDLVIVDVKLGAEDGYTLIDRVKMLYPEIMVVVLTSLNTRRSFVQALKVGASDYILKPFEDDYVREKLKMHIQNFEKSKSIPDYSPNQLDQAVFQAVKNAVNESNELLIGLVVIYHKHPASNTSTTVKDLAILRSLTAEVSKQTLSEDGIFNLGNNGIVFILPKRPFEEKEKIKESFMMQLQAFLDVNHVEDTFIVGEFISLPNEIDPKKNALSVLAKKIELMIK